MAKFIFRDDDILISSSGFSDSVKRLQQVHSWFAEDRVNLVHTVSVLVHDIQQFPAAIEFIKEEHKNGNMVVELHGLQHIDYAKLSEEAIRRHLSICKEWFSNTLGFLPTKFYTPWGANARHIVEASIKEGLIMVDCSNVMKPSHVLQAMVRNYPFEHFDNKEILFHWWERGRRIERIVACYKAGSFAAAKAADKELFND